MTEAVPQPQSKRRGWARFLTFLLVGTLAILFGGFIAFAQFTDGLRSPEVIPTADGIVVWTGKGGGRLEAGAALLEKQKGERLLISGVNERNGPVEISDISGLSETLADCCLDLDYAAKDTSGNARETASWAQALGYDHIILVTSAYHMPRAQVEISATAGRMRITPFPVERADSRNWYKSASRTKRLFQEYLKLLLSYAKGRNKNIDPPLLEALPQN